MKDRFPLYPEDRSNSFGRANELNKSGGIFDSVTPNKIKRGKALNVSEQDLIDQIQASDDKNTPSDHSQITSVKTASDAGAKKTKVEAASDAGAKKTKVKAASDAGAKKTKVKAAPDTAAKKTKVKAVSDKAAPKAKENPKSAKKLVMRVAIVAAGVLLTAVVLGVIYLNSHMIIGELFGKHAIYSLNTTEIDLSGSDYKDYSQLSRLKSLETVDLTNSTFNELSDLYGCKKLKKVILSDRVLSSENCIEFYQHIPAADLVCRVDISGEIHDSGLTELKLNSADPESIKKYAALNRLEQIDLTEAEISDETLKEAYAVFPDCNIVAMIDLNGHQYRTDAEQVNLSGALTSRDAEVIRLFKHLKKIDVVKCTNSELIDQFISDHPEITVSTPLNLLGKTVGTEDDFVDLRGRQYTLQQVRDALKEVLPKMKSLKKIDMCGCGLNNREMEKLCNDYPDIKFVWMIHFGRWDVRTDAVAFAALNSNGEEFYNQEHYAPLFKYCTDLRALDLGHSLITDISAVSSLKKLRAIILTDNRIRNINAFAELHDLEFIEMNATNNINSVEPLKDLKNLKYINLWDSDLLKDLSPLYHHDNLKIAIFDHEISKEEREKFVKSNPDCLTFFTVDTHNGLTTTKEWRENPYRAKLKKVFRSDRAFYNWKYVTGFDEETGEYIIDYSTDQYRYM